ncbi:phosphoribosylglycinamide formyltransferase [Reinekea thalattae]|nr:phosphoribosylglycinamide formyltransferase [Reinekea thalattae]
MKQPAVMKRLVVLISGGGSNLQTLLDACQRGDINGQVVAVISNRPDVRGLIRAEQAGADALCIDHTEYDSREAFDEQLRQHIDDYQPDYVILAGFMRILTASFVNHFLGKMVNIHPSLLPKYPGLDTHQRAIDANDSHAGATVHFVTPELDGGPLIMQSSVTLEPSDTAASLAKRVLATEHQLYPRVVQLLCQDKLKLIDNIAYYDQTPIHVPLQLDHTRTSS